MAGKKKGLLDGLKGALFEEDTSATPAPSVVEPARQFTPFGGASPNFFPTAAAPVPPLPGQAPYSPQSYAPPGVSIAPDPEALAAVQSAVYVPIEGRASNFVRFIEMHEALGKPADTGLALRALAASDRSTPAALAAAVAGDVAAHMRLLEAFCTSVDADFEAEKANRLGTKDREIADLTLKNEHAAAEIKRHSEEVAARTQDIARLTVERSEEEAKIGRGKAVMDAAEEHVRSNLVNSQQLFAKA